MNAHSFPSAQTPHTTRWPRPDAVLELLKPITWFPPMWAYLCGLVSVGASLGAWPSALAGVVLAGPLVCGTSQAINDWFDRDVDAINEPHRVIPSGRMPGRWGLYVAIAGTVISALWAAALGYWVFVATLIGLAMAWAYSAPPLRLKANGWWGNAAVGLSYESLPWITAAIVMTASAPSWPVLSIALLYGIGAHGILTINDFKALEGDRKLGVASIPVQLGPRRAALLCVATMQLAQLGVVGILLSLNLFWSALTIIVLLAAQAVVAWRFVKDPVQHAIWYSAIGVGLYVLGMMVSAVGLSTLAPIFGVGS